MATPENYHPQNRVEYVFEHDIEWGTCLECGAQWDAESGEEVTHGDDWCLENADEGV
jgi:hypothetical protein